VRSCDQSDAGDDIPLSCDHLMIALRSVFRPKVNRLT